MFLSYLFYLSVTVFQAPNETNVERLIEQNHSLSLGNSKRIKPAPKCTPFPQCTKGG